MTYERALMTKWLSLGLLGLLFIGFAGRLIYGNLDPGVNPPPPAPGSASFETLRKTAERLKPDEKAIGDAISPRSGSTGGSEKASASELLARHADTLHETRKVLDAGGVRVPGMRSFHDTMPYYANFRTLARLMVLEGREYEKRGEYTRAAACYRDVLHLSEAISHGGSLIGHLVTIAVGEIGRRDLWNVVPKLDPATAATLVRDLETVARNTQPMAKTLEEEKYGMQGGLLEIYRRPETLRANGDEDFINSFKPFTNPFIYAVAPKRETYANITRYMDTLIAQAEGPYRAHSAPSTKGMDILSQILLPVFEQATFKDVQTRANHALLITALKIRVLGGRAANIMPDPLPVDPFRADNGSITVRADIGQSNGFLVYSVGPDGTDDLGTAIDNPPPADRQNWNPRERRMPNPDSKGDIVAGVNYPYPTTR